MMFARLSIVTFAISLAATVSATYLAPISDKSVSQCGPLTLTFSGKQPLTVFVYPGCDADDETDTPLTKYTVNGTHATWIVDVEEGKSIMFGVEDANGNTDWSEDYVVAKSSNAACIGEFTSWSTSSANATSSTSTGPIANAGQQTAPATPSPSEPAKPQGAIGGALSSFRLQTEVAAFSVLASVFATSFLL